MKIRVGVFFGGQSVEHEVSIISASQAIDALNKDKYEIFPIYISKDSKMYFGEELFNIENFRDLDALLSTLEEVTLINQNNDVKIITPHKGLFKKKIEQIIDVAFPIVHGCNIEDGTLAGVFELLNIPYVGCDVYASSVCMDKYFSKCVLQQAGLPVLDGMLINTYKYNSEVDKTIEMIENKFSYPVIVKPINQGSSVGITVAKDAKGLATSLDFAFTFSSKVLVEKAITNLMEINCSVLGDLEDAKASILEEPINNGEVLSYEDKYLNGGKGSKLGSKTSGSTKSGMASLKRVIPARISDELTAKIQNIAVETFKTLDCSGVVRIDFIVDKDTDELYVNEINTIPGSLSFYLWDKTDKKYNVLLDDLIKLALKKKRNKENLKTSFETNILSGFIGGGTKGSKTN